MVLLTQTLTMSMSIVILLLSAMSSLYLVARLTFMLCIRSHMERCVRVGIIPTFCAWSVESIYTHLLVMKQILRNGILFCISFMVWAETRMNGFTSDVLARFLIILLLKEKQCL